MTPRRTAIITALDDARAWVDAYDSHEPTLGVLPASGVIRRLVAELEAERGAPRPAELTAARYVSVADELKQRLQLRYTGDTKDGSNCHLVETHLIALAEECLREAAMLSALPAPPQEPQQ